MTACVLVGGRGGRLCSCCVLLLCAVVQIPLQLGEPYRHPLCLQVPECLLTLSDEAVAREHAVWPPQAALGCARVLPGGVLGSIVGSLKLDLSLS